MSSRKELQLAYSQWVAALNERNADSLSTRTAETVTLEDKEVEREEFVRHVLGTLESASVDKIEPDMITVDVTTRAIAARVILGGTLKKPYLGVEVTGKPVEWVEYPLLWFDRSGKITRMMVLTDMESLRSNTAHITRTPTLKYSPSPSSSSLDLKDTYKAYLHTINTQTTTALNLQASVAPNITHNLQNATLPEFQGFLENNASIVEGLTLTLTELIVDEEMQQVASRIVLTGTPKGQFMGVECTGREMRFPEHAMYKFDGGRIRYIWAVRDVDTLRESLQGKDT